MSRPPNPAFDPFGLLRPSPAEITRHLAYALDAIPPQEFASEELRVVRQYRYHPELHVQRIDGAHPAIDPLNAVERAAMCRLLTWRGIPLPDFSAPDQRDAPAPSEADGRLPAASHGVAASGENGPCCTTPPAAEASGASAQQDMSDGSPVLLTTETPSDQASDELARSLRLCVPPEDWRRPQGRLWRLRPRRTTR